MSLNQYRNAHYRTLNTAKKEFALLMKEQIDQLPGYMRMELTFTMFPPTKRIYDLDNFGSVVAKFLQDALVEAKRIPEDNKDYIVRVEFLPGEVDKLQPRIECRIKDVSCNNNITQNKENN